MPEDIWRGGERNHSLKEGRNDLACLFSFSFQPRASVLFLLVLLGCYSQKIFTALSLFEEQSSINKWPLLFMLLLMLITTLTWTYSWTPLKHIRTIRTLFVNNVQHGFTCITWECCSFEFWIWFYIINKFPSIGISWVFLCIFT